MRSVEVLEVVSKGKKYFFVNGKRISENVAFKLTFYASDSDCYLTGRVGDKVRRQKILYFFSDDVYIANELLGE